MGLQMHFSLIMIIIIIKIKTSFSGDKKVYYIIFKVSLFTSVTYSTVKEAS